MAKRNDFLEGFLKGLYNAGVGNPEVQRANQKDVEDRNAALTAKMAEQGMVPNTLPSDHPISQKIGSFLSTMFGGASSAPLLASSFKADPTQPQYGLADTGETKAFPAGTPIPTGFKRLPPKTGEQYMSSQFKTNTNLADDYFTPDQVLSMTPPEVGQKLVSQFGDKVPGTAVTAAGLFYNRDRNATQRDQKDEKTRYRSYLLDMEQKDPVIKEMNKQGLALGQVDQMINLANKGNTVSSSAMGVKMARAMGEVGVLTESDITRYVQSGQLSRSVGDKLSRMANGKPTAATLSEIKQIGNVLRDNFKSQIQPRYDNYINSYSSIEGVTPEEFANKLKMPYGGSDRTKIVPTTSPVGNATHRWNPQTGQVEVIQ